LNKQGVHSVYSQMMFVHMYVVLGEQGISPELSDAFDTLLSTLAVHSADGKEAIEKAGGIVLTRLKSTIIIVTYFVIKTKDFQNMLSGVKVTAF